MTAISQFANLFDQMLSGNINWASDSIKMALLDATYTPNLTTHIHFSDVSGHDLPTSGGYTALGQALTTKTHTVTAANSFATTWAATTAHVVGDIIRPATGNGFLYLCSAAGITGSGTPTFPTTIGATVADATVTWTNIGESITQLGSDAPSWATASFSTRYAVIYDAQTGVTSTEPLMLLVDFGSTQSPSSTTFTVPKPGLGWTWWTAF